MYCSNLHTSSPMVDKLNQQDVILDGIEPPTHRSATPFDVLAHCSTTGLKYQNIQETFVFLVLTIKLTVSTHKLTVGDSNPPSSFLHKV